MAITGWTHRLVLRHANHDRRPTLSLLTANNVETVHAPSKINDNAPVETVPAPSKI